MSIRYKAIITTTAIVASLALTATALAASGPMQGQMGGRVGPNMGMHGGMTGMRPAVVGTVSSISGDSLVISSHGFGPNAATTTYSVDASNATVFKNNATSSVAAISTGDNVFVQGTVSGTNVTATTIRDGIATTGRSGPRGQMGQGKPGQTPLMFQGNGEPIVAGSLTSVSGNTITITNKSNVTYTIDTTNANIQKQGTGTTTVSSLNVGDSIIAQGTVNGNSVVASGVIDQGVPPAPRSATSTKPQGHQGGPAGFIGNIFGSIGGFFSHIFGF